MQTDADPAQAELAHLNIRIHQSTGNLMCPVGCIAGYDVLQRVPASSKLRSYRRQ
jgi:hypothetical protein